MKEDDFDQQGIAPTLDCAASQSYTVEDYRKDWEALFGFMPDFPDVDAERRSCYR